MRTTRIHKRVRRVLCLLLVILLVYTLGSMAFSAVFFRVMFSRRDSLPDIVAIPYEMLDTSRYPRKEIRFASGENTLRGWLYGEQGTFGLIIIAPGISDGADAHLAEMMTFADSGYAVLTYDATGMLQSGGSDRVGLQQAKRDLLAAIDFAKQDSALASKPLLLYGHSQGAYAAAAVLDEAEVDAAVCLSGFDSPVGTMYGKAKEYVGVLADVQYPFLYLQNWFIFGSDADDRAIESLNHGDTPVRIFYGSDDKVIPYPLSQYARAEDITNPNAECELIDEAYRSGHSYMWLSEDAAKYVAERQQELYDLRDACGGELPQELLDDFYRETDAERATETDGEFMNEILSFYRAAAH